MVHARPKVQNGSTALCLRTVPAYSHNATAGFPPPHLLLGLSGRLQGTSCLPARPCAGPRAARSPPGLLSPPLPPAPTGSTSAYSHLPNLPRARTQPAISLLLLSMRTSPTPAEKGVQALLPVRSHTRGAAGTWAPLSPWAAPLVRTVPSSVSWEAVVPSARTARHSTGTTRPSPPSGACVER